MTLFAVRTAARVGDELSDTKLDFNIRLLGHLRLDIGWHVFVERVALRPLKVAHCGDGLIAGCHKAGLIDECRADTHREAHFSQVLGQTLERAALLV